ncbi:thioredoxin domain-containing protein [Nocardia farcinica]|uniref:DsbA family protein n=1 Tax=Nocardia farcinica TaxID=37329 RepID=UPI000A38D16C|nr:thioredoxin domain-containing protein [Nocardia farcinica]MBA4857399.1 thioredoxin domain-containing protein [Nocardia farcinica]MBC9816899.1 thioredoxin domain-containing protein [Nocardia farcinica]MBF6071127.1 thioredoxin domain-containing protein [Nocardia farcinica]MBF6252893.1 thioredoxin domain-containing protein [Nocardia farcinica]MBF6292678.1 thioredoxin domain-containing protein [Nocardia farcinica]
MSNNPGRRNPLLEAERADRKRKIAIQAGVAAVLIGLVAAIGIGIAVKKAERDDPGPTPAIAAQTGAAVTGSITDSGAVRIGKPDATVTVRVVADLQCPACKNFEATYGQLLEDAVNNGTAAVEYNVISFLDRASTNEYSSRAANAAYCVAEQDPAKFQTWLKTMFAQQPAEGGAGHTDDQLIEIAREVGYTDAVAGCIQDRTYAKYVTSKTQAVFGEGVQSTPTVFVNGQQVQPNGVEQAIAAAAAGR